MTLASTALNLPIPINGYRTLEVAMNALTPTAADAIRRLNGCSIRDSIELCVYVRLSNVLSTVF